MSRNWYTCSISVNLQKQLFQTTNAISLYIKMSLIAKEFDTRYYNKIMSQILLTLMRCV